MRAGREEDRGVTEAGPVGRPLRRVTYDSQPAACMIGRLLSFFSCDQVCVHNCSLPALLLFIFLLALPLAYTQV